jgi:rhodanese-related sulfurtransferase
MSNTQPEIKRITCEHLRTLERQQADTKEHIVVDIRDLADYEAGHIEGSLHIPRRELSANLPSLIPEKARRVVVILGPTHEEEIEDVHAKLIEAGYGNIEYLAGGIDRYCEIADVDVSDVIEDMKDTDFVPAQHHESDIDPEKEDGEPLY